MAEDDLAFLNLVLMLGTMASQRLDAAVAPGANREEEIPRARESINMLAAVKKRSTGRLTVHEQKVIDTLMRDLQTRYVKALALKAG